MEEKIRSEKHSLEINSERVQLLERRNAREFSNRYYSSASSTPNMSRSSTPFSKARNERKTNPDNNETNDYFVNSQEEKPNLENESDLDDNEEIDLLVKALAKALKRKSTNTSHSEQNTSRNSINSVEEVLKKLKQLELNEISSDKSSTSEEKTYRPKSIEASQTLFSQKKFNSVPSTPFQKFLPNQNRNDFNSSTPLTCSTRNSTSSVPNYLRSKMLTPQISFSTPLPPPQWFDYLQSAKTNSLSNSSSTSNPHSSEPSLKYFDFFVKTLQHRLNDLEKEGGNKEIKGKSAMAQKVKFADRMEGFRESFATEENEEHLPIEMYEGFLVELRRREKQLLKEKIEVQQKLESEEWEKKRGPLPNWYQFKTKKFTEEMERFKKERGK